MSRAKMLARRLPDERTGALIVSPLSLTYLCGYPVENGIALIFGEDSFLFVSESDFPEIKENAADINVQILKSGKQLLDLLIKYGIKRLLIEPERMTVAEYNIFKEQLHYAELEASDELSGHLMQMRSIKSDEEIAAIADAQRICDKAYERILGTARKGMTERQIASLLDFYLTDYGAQEIALPTVILSGENTAEPRLRPGDRQIREGDLMIMEFGAKFGGYCAKMCRTVAVGEIGSRQENAYNAVSCAISDGLKALRAGIGGKVADSVARSTLNAWSVDQYCSVNFAHGIGLEPSEPPFIGQNSGSMLRENTVLSVSCGVCIPGKFGVKIGDMAVLTEEGCVDFTAATKSLVHI